MKTDYHLTFTVDTDAELKPKFRNAEELATALKAVLTNRYGFEAIEAIEPMIGTRRKKKAKGEIYAINISKI